MRSTLLVVLAMLAAVALAPAASAAMQVCTSAASASCPGAFCQDKNGDRVFQRSECAEVDPCAFQSDCCGGPLGGGFWCPDEW